jgi:hypothetical protein
MLSFFKRSWSVQTSIVAEMPIRPGIQNHDTWMHRVQLVPPPPNTKPCIWVFDLRYVFIVIVKRPGDKSSCSMYPSRRHGLSSFFYSILTLFFSIFVPRNRLSLMACSVIWVGNYCFALCLQKLPLCKSCRNTQAEHALDFLRWHAHAARCAAHHMYTQSHASRYFFEFNGRYPFT